MKNSEKFEEYLKWAMRINYEIYTLMFVKFDFKKNKIKFKYYPENLYNINELEKTGWVGLRMHDTDDYYRFTYVNDLGIVSNLVFSLTKPLGWVYTGDDQLLNSRAKITKIEGGTKTNLRKKKIKTDHSRWKITVENLGSLKGLEKYDSKNIINEYNKNKSSVFSMFKNNSEADDSETIIKEYKKLKL